MADIPDGGCALVPGPSYHQAEAAPALLGPHGVHSYKQLSPSQPNPSGAPTPPSTSVRPPLTALPGRPPPATAASPEGQAAETTVTPCPSRTGQHQTEVSRFGGTPTLSPACLAPEPTWQAGHGPGVGLPRETEGQGTDSQGYNSAG